MTLQTNICQLDNSFLTTPEKFEKWVAKNQVKLINELGGIRVGDTVTYTNDNGVTFPGLTVLGIDADASFYGRQIYLNTDAYWFPHTLDELKKENY